MKNNVLIISSDNDCIDTITIQSEKNNLSICIYSNLEKAIKHITFEDYSFYFIDLDLSADKAISFINLLNDLKDKPITIVITSPILKELEALVRGTDVTAIMNKPIMKKDIEEIFNNQINMAKGADMDVAPFNK